MLSKTDFLDNGAVAVVFLSFPVLNLHSLVSELKRLHKKYGRNYDMITKELATKTRLILCSISIMCKEVFIDLVNLSP